MKREQSLRRRTVGVIGFNSRPIACSLKKLGARVVVSDYWGDEDLDSCCDNWLALLTPTPGKRQRQTLGIPLPVALVENMKLLMKEECLDYLMVGSGFDDHSHALDEIGEHNLLLGNSPSTMARARRIERISNIAAKHQIDVPLRGNATTVNRARQIAEQIGFPVVVRPPASGGGSGIRLARDEAELELLAQQKNEMVIQQYINGRDLSASVVASEEGSVVLSIQGQLIGMPSAGRNCDFAYCGNYLPFRLDSDVQQRIEEFTHEVCMNLGLSGSNGFDFVYDSKSNLWLMEANPRIQGTLELIELAGGVSVTDIHFQSCKNNILPDEIELNDGVKMIVYSRKDMSVSGLNQLEDVFDKTPEGVHVNRGDPICTIIRVGASLIDCYESVSSTARLIQR